MQIAEQVAVAAPLPLIVEYLSTKAARWMRPFLVLAWNEAEQRTRHRSSSVLEHRRICTHRLKIGARDTTSTSTTFGFEWRVCDDGALLQRLAGELLLETLGRGSLIAIRATSRSQSEWPEQNSAMRPAETAARLLLGYVRAAIEDSARTQEIDVASRPSGDSPVRHPAYGMSPLAPTANAWTEVGERRLPETLRVHPSVRRDVADRAGAAVERVGRQFGPSKRPGQRHDARNS